MRYRLAVLTHGDSDTLADALDSFDEHVTPAPAELCCVRDGPGTLPPIREDGRSWNGIVVVPQRGFCEATRTLWQHVARDSECEFVFWLEHDFVFTQDVDLNEMAALLSGIPSLAQVALVRQPVNDRELQAGGLYARLRESERSIDRGSDPPLVKHPFMIHDRYFTTNPSLMRTHFMQLNPWTAEGVECEGRFGIQLRERGFFFAAWGDGTPQVEHIGVRSGSGY